MLQKLQLGGEERGGVDCADGTQRPDKDGIIMPGNHRGDPEKPAAAPADDWRALRRAKPIMHRADFSPESGALSKFSSQTGEMVTAL